MAEGCGLVLDITDEIFEVLLSIDNLSSQIQRWKFQRSLEFSGGKKFFQREWGGEVSRKYTTLFIKVFPI